VEEAAGEGGQEEAGYSRDSDDSGSDFEDDDYEDEDESDDYAYSSGEEENMEVQCIVYCA
jgi:hypothetical protein